MTISTPAARLLCASSSMAYVLPTPAAYPRNILREPRLGGLDLREDSDIHAFGGFDQAVDDAARQRQPAAPLRVADENLRNPVFLSKVNNLVDRISPLQDMDLGPHFAGEVQIGIQ